MRTILNDTENINLRSKLNSIWDIKEHYWYPLISCNREDLIAFNSNYIVNKEKLNVIKTILIEHGVAKLFEFREDGLAYAIENVVDYSFWESDDYFWNNEGFWFDENMDWIIYISHEAIVTFGGKLIIQKLKQAWKDWDKNLKWDTKNIQI